MLYFEQVWWTTLGSIGLLRRQKVKEYIKNISENYEKSMKEIQNYDSRANIIINIFKNIYKTAEVTPNIKFTEVVTSEIDQLINICEKEQKV